MVGGVVGLNALVGGVQRFRTERAIDELSRAVKVPVLVRRGGREEQVDSDQLVKGDVVLLGSGDVVPADCRLVDSSGLEVDASGVTGESLPVGKSSTPSFEDSVADRSSMLYAGTTVASGRASAVVVALGAETEAHRGAAAFRVSARDSGVERRMRQLMDLTAPVALAAGVGVIGVGLLRGRKMDELVGSAVSLAVASVPEGLPLLATAAQLAAARRLKQKGALVRNVRSLEAIGRVDTVCLDKTGTVTEGSIVLGSVSDSQQEELTAALSGARKDVLRAALRASPMRPGDMGKADPVDAAIWRAAEELEVGLQTTDSNWSRISEVPFEAERSYSAVLGQTSAGLRLSVKGAPEALFSRCGSEQIDGAVVPLSPSREREIQALVSTLADRGLRVLAVADRLLEDGHELSVESARDLTFRGLLAFRDPVRPTAMKALADLKRGGLRPLMITGDHPSTAQAIAVELNLSVHPQLLTGAELAKMDEGELLEQVDRIDVFARVSPSQKVRIVRALSKKGHTVAMVGDGANDAPAIRLASVGVAMGQGCAEAARNAADIILVDARVETLVEAIIEGRALWDSVRDAVSILVGGNLGEIGFTLVGGLISGRPPLSPRQLLLVNLFTDVAPATALALRPPKKESLAALAERGPEASMGWRLDRDIGARALVTASGAGAAWITSSFIGDRRGASTTALLALVGTQLGQTMTSGERSRQVLATNILSALGLAIIVQTPGVSGTFGCRPLGPMGWGIAAGASTLATMAGRYAPELVEDFIRSKFSAETPGPGLKMDTGASATLSPTPDAERVT
jgi:calcium-translocating P-type ATPase